MSEELRPDVAAAMAKMETKIGAKREIKRLPEHLWHGESVFALASGTYGPGMGILVMTDRRLLFLKDGFTAKLSEDFPFDKISSIQWQTGMLMGTVTVFVSGNKSEIKNVSKSDGKNIVDAVRARISAGSLHQAPPMTGPMPPQAFAARDVPSNNPSIQPGAKAPTPAVPGDDAARVFDQIRTLGELHQAGILTEQEFTEKKTELLGRL
ncbi:PH domain-containing protein [Nocardioides sp. CFH 31398]|uniref:PH domain-containing protein n=1 Tax=Nocardioides sp. CFH 31398 TaxID=2919579 RepID=UPI001F066467|nr:PH domain-containing protein [Nocardioides sp. CFH 31398]MCH1867470.1 PH domain-containing protein [Nocardioides sp. CFH 31398]